MTTDKTLVERLRSKPTRRDSLASVLNQRTEAADRIEALEADLSASQAALAETLEIVQTQRAENERLRAWKEGAVEAAEDATEYVLASINRDLKAENARLREALAYAGVDVDDITGYLAPPEAKDKP